MVSNSTIKHNLYFLTYVTQAQTNSFLNDVRFEKEEKWNLHDLLQETVGNGNICNVLKGFSER